MRYVSVVLALYYVLEAGRTFKGLRAVLVFVTMPIFKFSNFLTNFQAVDLPFRVKPTSRDVDVQNNLFKHHL